MPCRRVACWIASALAIAIFSQAASDDAARAQTRNEAPTAHGASHRHVTNRPEWRFEVGTYIWAPAVNGDVTVDAERIPIDADVADIVKDADSLFALNLFFLARKGKWGLLVQPQYMQIGADSGDPLMVKVVARIVIGEVSGFYTFLESSFRGSFRNVVAVDAILGLRLWWLGVQVKAVDGLVTGEGYRVWVDPLAGLALRLELFDGHLPIVLRGDFGGWGVGSTIALGGEASAGYRWFRKRLDITLALSYRALAPDYSSPSGDFGFDAVLHGPAVAVDFGF